MYYRICLFLIVIFTCISSAIAQKPKPPKEYRRSGRTISLEQAERRDPSTVQYLWVYADTDVFPDSSILKYENLISIQVIGRTSLSKKDGATVPVRISLIDTVGLRSLKHLRHLSFMHIDLADLPDEILDPRLESLTMVECLIRKLPYQIGELRKLKVLHLGYNYLHDLPSTMVKMDSLQFIYLQNNHFRSWPGELSSIPKLRYVHLGNGGAAHDERDPAVAKESPGRGWRWPFPSCANHFDWRDHQMEIKELIERERFERLILFTPRCGDREKAMKRLGTPFIGGKVKWDKPSICAWQWPYRYLDEFDPEPDEWGYLKEKGICACSLIGY